MPLSSSSSDETRQLEDFRQRLERDRTDLLERLNGSEQFNTLDGGGQPSNDSIESTERETTLRHRDTLLRRSHQVMRALERIQNGTFGVCLKCESRIEPVRLAHDPSLDLCLACQTEDDRPLRTPSL